MSSVLVARRDLFAMPVRSIDRTVHPLWTIPSGALLNRSAENGEYVELLYGGRRFKCHREEFNECTGTLPNW
jgi:hypothetical protein